jgi:uncharacterized protein YndB with AHSA1/START domain
MTAATKDFVVSRVFDAPRDLVWKAWTEADRLKEWFGPKGVTIPTLKMDLRPGGVCHYAMRMPNGQEMWGKWTFREVVAPERLVLISSFSDANGGVTRHPMSPAWPLETLSTTTFVESGGKTTLSITWSPYNATDAERETFNTSHSGMTQGWAGTMEQLTAYLAKAQAKK